MNGKNIGIAIAVIAIAVVAIALLWRPAATPMQTACTMEAKICPDGSAVGRTGPNCEFAACPAPDDGLQTKYIKAQEWPPTVTVTDGPLTCAGKKIINGTPYCITAQSEGAAGSTYTTYTYAAEKDWKIITLSFVLRAVQCMNYDNPEQAECLAERAAFDVDALADQIFKSTKLVD